MPATSVRCSVPTSIEQLHQLARVRHLLGREHLGDAQVDLHEVVDGDPAGVRIRRGAAARRPAAARSRLRGVLFVSSGSSVSCPSASDRVQLCVAGLSASCALSLESRRAATARRPSRSSARLRSATRAASSVRRRGRGRFADAAQDLRGRSRDDRQQQDRRRRAALPRRRRGPG